ncbi:hypothetical protein CNR22_18335 [Sphingobacteriaceae bacterium]|nr:hypothetical protein CNR22_18335 [Sphingobacteriaceae bacterium]
MLKKLILDDGNLSFKGFYRWWESRRLIFNFIVILFSFFAFNLLSIFVHEPTQLFNPPISFFGYYFVFLIAVNIFYFLFYVVIYLTHDKHNKIVKKLRLYSFTLVLGLLFFIMLIPLFAALSYTSIVGSEIASRSPEYVMKEVHREDIVGEYTIDIVSKWQFNIEDKVAGKTIARFNADSTFELEYFPFDFDTELKSTYKIIHASGTWKLEKYFDRHWVIPLIFERCQELGSNYIELTRVNYFNSFLVNNGDRHYGIYVAFDKFSINGLVLYKR